MQFDPTAAATAAGRSVGTPAWTAGRSPCNGVELAWEQAGPAHAPAVLLVMGLTWQLTEWPESFCQGLLAHGLRVIRFDNRDIGLSGEVKGGIRISMGGSVLRNKLRLPIKADYTLHDMAADALALMDTLNVPRAHLIGVSMGGMISQIVAGSAPDRVLSLCSIMSTTNHPWLPGPKSVVLKRIFGKRPVNPSREDVIARDMEMRRLIGSPGHPTSDGRLQALAERAYDRSFRPGGIMRQTHAIVATGSFESLLRQIKVPTQIIHGKDDPLVRPSGGQRSARLIRDARLELIDGMGHDLPESLVPRLLSLITANMDRAR